MPAKIIAICAKKGGTGKTTTAIQLGVGLLIAGKKVLLIDMDSQCNLSSATMAYNDEQVSIFDALHIKKGKMKPSVAIKDAITIITPTNTDKQSKDGTEDSPPPSPVDEDPLTDTSRRLHVVQSALNLEELNIELSSRADGPFRLKNALESIRDYYDYIIIDTPPAIEAITQTAILASDEIIITAQADQFTADGILQLAWVLQGFQGLPGTNFKIAGILLTRFSERSTIRREMRDAISAIAKDLDTKVYNTFIRENVAIVESQFLHSSVYKHNKRSNGAIDYYNFVKEFLMDHGVQESEIPEFIKPEV